MGHLSLDEPATSPKKAVSIAERSEDVREKLAVDLHGTAEMLHTIPRSKNPAHLAKRRGVVHQVAETSEKVFGWKDSEPESIINVLNLSQARLLPSEQDIIELESAEPDSDYSI